MYIAFPPSSHKEFRKLELLNAFKPIHLLLHLCDNYAAEYDYSGLKYINHIFMVLRNPSQLSQRQLISCPGSRKHKKKPKLILIEANEGKLAISEH